VAKDLADDRDYSKQDDVVEFISQKLVHNPPNSLDGYSLVKTYVNQPQSLAFKGKERKKKGCVKELLAKKRKLMRVS
jgi:hypothetical protein